MIIVSQDKTRTTDNIELQIEKQKMGEKYLILNKGVFFWIYETKERAKEVLLEITKVYENAELYKCCSNADIQVAAATLALKEHKNIFIYEMPAE